MTLSLGTLYLLRRCLNAQNLNVGDPGFAEMAPAAIQAQAELEAAIAAAETAAQVPKGES